MITTLYATNVWYVQFWIKKVVENWWGNNEILTIKKSEYNLKIILNELKQQIVGVESTIESIICIIFK